MAESGKVPKHLVGLDVAIVALLAWAAGSHVPILLIGGVAVSLLSNPRTTKDVDAVVWLPDPNNWNAFVAAGKQYGIMPRSADAVDFALASRVLLMVHSSSGVPLDVSVAALDFEEEAIRNAVITDVGSHRFPLPRVEDLLIMKAIAHRAQDAADIESLLRTHPDVETARVLAIVRQFAEILDSPDLVEDLLRLLPKRAPTKPRTKRTGPKK